MFTPSAPFFLCLCDAKFYRIISIYPHPWPAPENGRDAPPDPPWSSGYDAQPDILHSPGTWKRSAPAPAVHPEKDNSSQRTHHTFEFCPRGSAPRGESHVRLLRISAFHDELRRVSVDCPVEVVLYLCEKLFRGFGRGIVIQGG